MVVGGAATVLGIATNYHSGWFFSRGGATDQSVRTNIAITRGIVTDVEDIKANVQVLKELVANGARTGGVEWSRKYPLGYMLLGLGGQKDFVPFNDPKGRIQVTNWEALKFEVSPELIKVTLPKIVLNTLSSLENTTTTLPNRVGARHGVARVGDIGLVLEVVEIAKGGEVLLLLALQQANI